MIKNPKKVGYLGSRQYSKTPPKIVLETLTLRLKIAQKPYMVWSLGPKALKYESFEGEGK